MIFTRVNEIRLSGRFLRLQQDLADESAPQSVHLYRRLAADRVNIAFLQLDFLCSPRRITCLVAPEASSRLDAAPCAGLTAGLISVFPHRYHPAVIGAILRAFSHENTGWHGMATSGSMLTLSTDFLQMKPMAKAVSRTVDLPAGHKLRSPGQDYDFVAKSLKTAPETVAQYVESRIKTYGIQVKTGLTICSATIQQDALESWGLSMDEMTGRGYRFAYASAAIGQNREIRLNLVMNPNEDGVYDAGIRTHLPPNDAFSQLEFFENAEMICFHGPHFGDRYGIADKALSRLGFPEIPVWLAGCVGSTVSIVVPPAMGAAAAEALSDVFSTPLAVLKDAQYGYNYE
jgi:hypothetical protein